MSTTYGNPGVRLPELKVPKIVSQDEAEVQTGEEYSPREIKQKIRAARKEKFKAYGKIVAGTAAALALPVALGLTAVYNPGAFSSITESLGKNPDAAYVAIPLMVGATLPSYPGVVLASQGEDELRAANQDLRQYKAAKA